MNQTVKKIGDLEWWKIGLTTEQVHSAIKYIVILNAIVNKDPFFVNRYNLMV